jgi:transcriptional regulator with PAS, ATPase and Fis domain
MLRVEKAFEYRDLVQENANLKEQLGTRFRFENIVGTSSKMIELYETLEMVSSSKASVLIQGESGTGKELVARAIHENSPNRSGPFIKINCAALPDTLMESELFGHEKGAFTGAIKMVEGRFSLAHDGTLLLDEVSEMSPNMQAKLLRVLQEREFERLGGRETIKTNARVVATTNRDLKAMVRQEKFREDLYYRLNVCPIILPPLCERKEDIPLLANHFLQIYTKEYNRPIESMTEDALGALIRYDWPGNVRELRNLAERLAHLTENFTKNLEEVPDWIREELQRPHGIKKPDIEPEARNLNLKELEQLYIKKISESSPIKKTDLAKLLGISRTTLWKKTKPS